MNRDKRHGANEPPVPAGDRTGPDRCPVIVAGIGASESGLSSLQQLFAKMDAGRGVAFVLIQHPTTARKDQTIEWLRDQTTFSVVEATDGMEVLPDRIHVVPPDKFLNISGSRLTLQEPILCNGLRMPIDHFFCSLASDQGRRGCGVLLSGAGGDGTLGLSEIKAAGGRTFVENPDRAERSEMVQNAINAGVVDAILSPHHLAEAILALAAQVTAETRNEPPLSPAFDADLRAVLDILRTRVGHDFHGYKPATLVRRIRRRMALGKVATFADYARFLEEHPDEIPLLYKDLLIGVTEFFRQPQAWDVLEEKVIGALVEKAQPGSEIRVWVPGCATGKEVYSFAMLLSEQMEKSGKELSIQIFATDSDGDALVTARSGIYSAEDLGPNVSPGRRKRFFANRDGRYQVIKEIRQNIVFAPQNLTADPPFSRLDLIICRNLLIYLDQAVQKKVIPLFHFALREGGFLFLGNAETIGDREDLFEPVSKKWRIYRRIGVGRRVAVEIALRPSTEPLPAVGTFPVGAPAPRMSLASAAQQMLVERFAPACVMIDRKLQVLYVHGEVEGYLTFPSGELTTKVVDMAREGLRARLRGAVNKCIERNKSVSFTARVRRGEKSVPVRTVVSPLRYPREADGLLLVTFEDYRVPASKSCRQGPGEGDVRQMEDELKVMREELQSTIEQLESSNDQLKASNEEVTAANEELQSANEELETSKEELQSLNEELNTLNARLQEKVEELEGANNDVMNLLSSTHIATVFLDKDLKVKRYTPTVTRLFSLIPSDVGRPAAEILRRFTDETLLDDAALVLAELTSIATEVRAEDGRWYIRRITPYRTQDDRIEGVVVTFTDFTERKQAEEALREAHDRARWLARFPGENPNPVVRVSAEGRVLYSNPVAARLAGWECSVGEPMVHAVLPLVGKAMAEGRAVDEDVVLGGTSYAITVAPISAEGYANIYGRNISDRKRAEDALREIAQRLSRAQEMAHLGSWELDVVKNELTWSDEVYRIFGLEPQAFGATYEAFLERVHPDDRAAVDEAYAGSVREGKDAYEIEHRVVRKGTGEIRWVHEKCQHVRDGTGRIIRSLGMVLDVTERKQGEERIKTSLGEKEVLLKEIHHRVKNNMQVISSLVSLQAEGSEDEAVRGLLRDVTDRVRSMALVHEKLYQSSDLARVDFAEYARSLLSYLWRAHGASGTGVRLDLDLEPVSLAVDAAVPCGLILNELAGNALKHAFLGRSEGQVTVSLHGGAAGPVCLRVRDDGVGLPAGLDWRKTRSLGLRLVQMLTGQLGGTVEVRGGEGTAFEITFGGQQSLS